MISYFLALLCGVVILALDQFTKYYIVSNYALGDSSDFIKGFIDIIYINNKGGAWGILEGYTWILLAITAILMIVCFTMLLKLGKQNKLIFWSITFILFGGLGNMIDRIFRDGNVIDFLHFEFYPTFPIFNVADCAVVLGACLLLAYFIFDSVKELRIKRKSINNFNQKNDGN